MKSSNLTRSVFRAIIANRPYTIRNCQRRAGGRNTPVPLRPTYALKQTRSFLGLNLGAAGRGLQGQRSTPGNLDVALGKLVDVVRAIRTQSRLPPQEQVIDAFRYLFASRLETPQRLTRNEVFLATETFKYLQERGYVLGVDDKTSLTEADLENVLLAIASSTEKDKYRTDARILATHVFDSLRSRNISVVGEGTPGQGQEQGYSPTKGSLLATYIAVLSKTGSANEALDLLRKSSEKSDVRNLPLWTAALKGLVNEGRVDEFWKVAQEVQDTFGAFDAASQESLAVFFADRDDGAMLKKVFHLPLEGQEPSTASLVKAIGCCIKNEELDWAANLVELLCQRTDSGDVAPTLLLWHVIHDPDPKSLRKKVEELSRNGVTDAVSMNTFNRLIEYAYMKQKPQDAALYLHIAESLGLVPDATSYTLQLQYHLQKSDLESASQSFELLSREDIPSPRVDIPVLNEYITSLAYAPDSSYDQLMHVTNYLISTSADLSSTALAGLSHVFLMKDELEEATGLLRHRVDTLPAADRAVISAVFRQFIVDPEVRDHRAFNAYELFRHAFPESPPSQRLPLMQSFFDRDRPDLACLVFGHMRQRQDSEARPNAEAYTQCFAGVAKCRDVDGLQMVYNMLKLDLEVEPNTRIRNGLMKGYTACEQPFVSIIDFFWKTLDSREGPTMGTLLLALQACEKWVPQGAKEARHIMALMQGWNMNITKEIYDAYIGALAGQSEFENVVELIEEMEADIGEAPDAYTIATFYNAIPWQWRKDEVEKWARQAFPELWADLEAFGDEIDEEWEIRYFKIERDVDISEADELLFGAGEYVPKLARDTVEALETPLK